MKKKGLIIGIIIAIVAIVIVVGCVAIYIAKGFTQELAIKEEIQAIDQITNVTDLQTIDMEAFNQKTDSVVTTGDYAIVENYNPAVALHETSPLCIPCFPLSSFR